MSGPKLIELRRMRAARERQRDHDRCAGWASEYGRLAEEFDEWARRLAGLGLAEQESVRQLAAVKTEADDWLQQGLHHEAARIFGEEVLRLRGLVHHRRAQFQERMLNLQQRHQQLLRDRETILAERAPFEARLRAAIPSDWPEPEKGRLLDLVEQSLRLATAPAALKFPDDAESVAALEQAEQQAASALAALQAAPLRLKEEMDASRLRIIDATLTPAAQPDASCGAPGTARPTFAALVGRAVPSAPLHEFVKQKPVGGEDKLVAELERVLAAVAAWSPEDSFLQPTRAKAAELSLENDPVRRRMLAEGLLIDCSRRLATLHEQARCREKVQELIDSAAHLDDEAVRGVVSELRQVLAAGGVADETRRARLRAAIEAGEARREREQKRRALVDALKEMGYETREGMETAFVQEGRLVLRRPGEEEYAVEMVANADLTQLQTALVRFAANSEMTEQQRRRDLEQEERWCGDHDRLRAAMAERGVETPFRMRHKPGEHPVRVLVETDRAASAGQGGTVAANVRRRT